MSKEVICSPCIIFCSVSGPNSTEIFYELLFPYYLFLSFQDILHVELSLQIRHYPSEKHALKTADRKRLTDSTGYLLAVN